MRIVNTVRGPVSSDQLGGVLAHEHIIFGYPGWDGDLSHDAFNVSNVTADVRNMMKPLEPYGVKTIIDPTPNECGRSVAELKLIAEALDINIVAGTGYYYQGEGSPAYFHLRKLGGCDVVQEIKEMFERELYEGIMDTGIKAGVIKLASSVEGITPYEESFFEAACKVASNDKDIRIVTHLTGGGALKEQADYFKKHGVEPRQVNLGHVCGNGELDLQKELAKEGFFLGYDRIGLANFGGSPTDNVRVERMNELHKAGLSSQILVSTDRIISFKGRASNYKKEIVEAMLGKQYWGRIFDYVIPELLKLGWCEQDTKDLYTTNPAHFYGK